MLYSFCSLFYDVESVAYCTASKRRMTDEEMEGSGRGLNEVLSSREGITIPGVPARIGTQHLPDTI